MSTHNICFYGELRKISIRSLCLLLTNHIPKFEQGFSKLLGNTDVQVDAIQMGTHNICCLYKEVDKKYTGCNLKTA